MHDLMTTPERARRRRIGWLALALAIALLPDVSAAQGSVLRVTLRDAAGQGLPGITIILRDEAGQELDRQVTDVTGAVTFDLVDAIVRVAVEGQVPDGPRLIQLGDDAAGVRVTLDPSDNHRAIDLRVEADGLVLPDPATMLSLEQGGASVAPDLPSAQQEPSGQVVDPAPETAPPAPWWAPGVTLLVIVAALGGLLLLRRGRAA
jgi:hypothetical protein